MVDELTCAECGSKFSSNLRYCPNCKYNVKSKEPKKLNSINKIFESNAWGIILFIFGIVALFGSEWYSYLMAILFFGFGIRILYKNHKMKNHDNVTDILRKRYAKGEITKEEFDKMKEDLS